ncbi:Wadjet anti-phage system protein JetD domain-containing protein [Glutamicibacter sp.]|uniref:Wadjet anti-phage system protein JetD domain-containing protein n=1 Tax=Glutamicibacter sp. TaxID=1931995 RepID=UPI0028BF0F23|nr:Wadjet anti-phage system protein JetD domain-containing protein [Glutamicibacter sp.]
MKMPEDITNDIRRRLTARWHTDLSGVEQAFPHRFPLGRPTAADLRQDYAAIHAKTVEWQDWARVHGIVLEYVNRSARGGTTQAVPTHARIDSIDHAAAIVADNWPTRLTRGRERLDVVRFRFPEIADAGQIIRMVDEYHDTDFELLLTVADWFMADASRSRLGVTPRQIPIPGVHAKWLQNHGAGVRALTGLDDLGVLPSHPSRIHFTYLDPRHRASGLRLHDSATVGDAFRPAYEPEIVVISENKDTAIHFPPIVSGISVEGQGSGGKTLAAFDWIRNAPIVVYWGDIDKDGLEILNGYRVDFDRDIDTMLMDEEAYDEFERFGTNHDKHGRLIVASDSKPVERLRVSEKNLYLRLIGPQLRGHRRIEQERIPLERAAISINVIRAQITSG